MRTYLAIASISGFVSCGLNEIIALPGTPSSMTLVMFAIVLPWIHLSSLRLSSGNGDWPSTPWQAWHFAA